MQLLLPKTRSSSSSTSFDHVKEPYQSASVQDLVSRAKQTPDTTKLVQLVEQARELQIQPFHFAAVENDRRFYGMMMAFLPLKTFVKEVLAVTQSGLSAIECAKLMESSLATEIENFLLSRGVLSTQGGCGFVIAHSTSLSLSPSFGPSSIGDPQLKRIEVGSKRFVLCSKSASNVGATLRANGIHYAATKAVYVQQVCFQTLEELACYKDKLLAFSNSDIVLSVVWTGTKIADLATDERFRAAFKIFSPCKSASQQVAPGMSVLLDLENLSSRPSADEKSMILRLYPLAGSVDTKAHTAISASGVRVKDFGYDDDDFLKGFRRGWYSDTLYARYVGDISDSFLSMGDAGKRYKYNIRKKHDFGYDNTRVMINLPEEGVVYCRGVGNDHANPEMACVLFDGNANICERYAYLGKLGRWNDIVQ